MPTVLVVDDEPWVRQVLEALLQSEGCEVWLTSSGGEALQLYRRYHEVIDLVLLDVLMPEMDGPATLEALRAINPSVPCWFMTVGTSGHDEEADRLLGLGVEAVLPKPFPPESIRGLFQRLRHRTRSSRPAP